ncbi:diaminopimelate decarboxylase [Acidisphaera sp. L21]|uniref:diaminopimelate decarboxylase n=1 Tax=Acidisphaera sp. L21 TaxID=1641851 RepID=UPI00131B46C6|nr:diaminopimelate decarboxylase [Acidisphaera sp. L21]
MAALAPVPDTAEPSFAELLAGRPFLSMHAQDGLLLEDVPLSAIADAVGTPCWVVSAGTLRARLAALRAAFDPLRAHVHYAVKANDHLAILRLMAAGGAGADVVSGGEMQRALLAGIPPDRIVFSGVGKQPPELLQAAQAGIAQINVESAEELEVLSAVASAAGHSVAVALRINPDVDAGTHAKITTGRADNKFGIGLDTAAALYAHAASLPGVRPVGLALHIGSQIGTTAPYRAAFARVADLVRTLRAAGQTVSRVDCGGGLGISYRDEVEGSPAAFAGAVGAMLGGMGLDLMIEPGRWLAGPAGLLLASVVLTKTTAGRRFTVLDAAMNDLVRPAMYDAWHGIVPLGAADAVAAVSDTDIVGPVCETGDTFARSRLLPPLAPHARVAILDAGAYGSVMSSTYNARPLAAQVMVDGDRWAVIRPRQPLESLWANETIPDWLAAR